jgi:hypothetical protein
MRDWKECDLVASSSKYLAVNCDWLSRDVFFIHQQKEGSRLSLSVASERTDRGCSLLRSDQTRDRRIQVRWCRSSVVVH